MAEVNKVADAILKKHLIVKLENGKDSNDDLYEVIHAAMEEYRLLGRHYTEDEIRVIQEQAYQAGIDSTRN